MGEVPLYLKTTPIAVPWSPSLPLESSDARGGGRRLHPGLAGTQVPGLAGIQVRHALVVPSSVYQLDAGKHQMAPITRRSKWLQLRGAFAQRQREGEGGLHSGVRFQGQEFRGKESLELHRVGDRTK